MSIKRWLPSLSNKRHVSHAGVCSWRGATLSGQGVCRRAVFTCYLPANSAACKAHTFACSVVCASSVRKILLWKKHKGLWLRTARKGCYFYILVFFSLRTLSGALAFIMGCCTCQKWFLLFFFEPHKYFPLAEVRGQASWLDEQDITNSKSDSLPFKCLLFHTPPTWKTPQSRNLQCLQLPLQVRHPVSKDPTGGAYEL